MPTTFLLTITLAVLAGCGPMPDTAPPTPPPAIPTIAAPVVATPGSPIASQLTLGDLTTRVNTAWPDVQSYRVTFTGGPVLAPSLPGTPAALASTTPAATPERGAAASLVSVREVARPDQQRQTVNGLGGDDHEAVLAGGRLFIRGLLTDQIVPGTPSGAWLELDPGSVAPGSRLAILLGGLPQPPPSPLAAVPERLWPQPLRDLGEAAFDGRACRAYGAADTVTQTGMRVDYVIAVDDRDLPCFIETTAGGIPRGRQEYTAIGAALDIAAPAGATPVASIPVALATPAARD